MVDPNYEGTGTGSLSIYWPSGVPLPTVTLVPPASLAVAVVLWLAIRAMGWRRLAAAVLGGSVLVIVRTEYRAPGSVPAGRGTVHCHSRGARGGIRPSLVSVSS